MEFQYNLINRLYKINSLFFELIGANFNFDSTWKLKKIKINLIKETTIISFYVPLKHVFDNS